MENDKNWMLELVVTLLFFGLLGACLLGIVSCSSSRPAAPGRLPAIVGDLVTSAGTIDDAARDIRASVVSGRKKAPDVEPEWTDIEAESLTITQESMRLENMAADLQEYEEVNADQGEQIICLTNEIAKLRDGQQAWLYRTLYSAAALGIVGALVLLYLQKFKLAGLAGTIAVGCAVAVRFLEAYLEWLVRGALAALLAGLAYLIYLLVTHRIAVADIIDKIQVSKGAIGTVAARSLREVLATEKPVTRQIVKSIKGKAKK